MADPSEDLEFNPFYQALQSRFLQQYEHAQQGCWLVCIPKAASLTGCNITRSFIDMHLLQPSVYLRDQYSVTVNGQTQHWQLSGNNLHCSSSSSTSLTIPVLSEELAYNKSFQQFRMFIVGRPLDPNYKPLAVRGHHDYAIRTRRTFEEHVQFLKSFESHREVLRDLSGKISVFMQHYLIVQQEELLRETASRLETIAKQAYTSFLEANRKDGRLQDRRVQEAVWLSMECYLLHKVHGKVFPVLCQVHRVQNATLSQRCKMLRGRLTPSRVGVSEDYDCSYRQTLLHLDRLEQCQSPLEQLYCLQDTMESVQYDAKEHFIKTLRHGEPDPLASDDLIALLATILTQSKCDHLYSSLYYMENFHWPPSDTDKLSYVMVTFHAAMEYIRGPDVQHLLPKKTLSPAKAPYSDTSNKKAEERRHVSPSPPPPSSSSSTSLSPFTESLASLTLTNHASPPPDPKKIIQPKNKELGPFLSLLVENDDTITSSSWNP